MTIQAAPEAALTVGAEVFALAEARALELASEQPAFAGGVPKDEAERIKAWTAHKRSVLNAKANGDDLEMGILGVIGGGFWSDGINARMVRAVLNDNKDAKRIRVLLDSPGGDYFDGVAIMSMLRRHKAHVTIEVIGEATSAGSVIAMGGDRIEMHVGTMMMIHRAWSLAMGNGSELRSAAEMLDKVDDGLIAIYKARTNADEKKIRSWVNATTWMSSAEAVERGFADGELAALPKKEADNSGSKASGARAEGAAATVHEANGGAVQSHSLSGSSADYRTLDWGDAPAEPPTVNMPATPSAAAAAIPPLVLDIDALNSGASQQPSADSANAAKTKFAKGDRVEALVDHMPGMKGSTGEVSIVRTEPAYYAVTFDGEKEPHKWLAEDELKATTKKKPMKKMESSSNTTPAPEDQEPQPPRLGEETIQMTGKTDPENALSPAVIRAMGLPAGATESDALAAVTRMRELELGVMTLTGVTNSSEALGAVRGLKATADGAAKVHADLAKLRNERDVQNFDALIMKGQSPPVKLSPASAKHYQDRFDAAVKEDAEKNDGACRSEAVVKDLQGFLACAPTIIAPAARPPETKRGGPAPEAGSLTYNGKAYADMKPLERSKLSQLEPELHAAMREDWISAGSPPPAAKTA